MVFLEAALVRDFVLIFLLTIFVFSLFVTLVLQFGLWTLGPGLRSKALQALLEYYFKFEFRPVIQRELQRLRKELKLREKLVSELNNEAGKLNEKVIFTEQELSMLRDVATEELTERLKRSAFGHQLLMELGDKAKDIFDELGKRYEVVADRVSRAWRSTMRMWSTVIALIFAIFLNIDSIYVAKTYLNSESTLLAVTAQKEALEQGYSDLQQSFDEDPAKTTISRHEFELAFRDRREQSNTVPVVGIPIGYSYYPYACRHENIVPDCTERGALKLPLFGRVFVLGDLMWFLGIYVTAILAGAGAPFWYDVANGISNTVRAAANKKPEQ